LKVISGGQTGVDRAALDAAIVVGLDYGGSVPKGRMAEDGPIDRSYSMLTEMPHGTYKVRTEKNIEDADATLIVTRGKPTNGTAYTITYARKLQKPILIVDLIDENFASSIQKVEEWLRSICPQVLNVAGPRESKLPGIYVQTFYILTTIFQQIANDDS
jgi:hypothetical protein